MGHAHGHAAERSSPRVRRLLLFALAPFAVITLLGLVLLWPGQAPPAQEGLGVARDTVRGTVESVEQVTCDESANDAPPDCTRAQVRLTSGPEKGVVVPIVLGNTDGSLRLTDGMKLVLGVEPSAPADLRYRVVDVQRGKALLVLGLLFAAAVIGLGRWRGVAALAGLAISLLVLVKFVLPGFLAGQSPLPVAVVGAAAIMFVAIYLAHGFAVRTSVAVLGTLISLVLTGILAAVFVAAGDFTGIATEEAGFIRAAYGQVDVHGLLLAGVIIGSLGVLDDVTVTQSSAIWELRAANPEMSPRALYAAGVRIGRDHIASTVNTLVLAYAGASLPLLLLFAVSGVGVGTALTAEVIAQEVVRTLVGSIGLVASVPVTTALAAFVVTRDAGWTPERGADDEWAGRLREVAGED